jgi:hypothetical protein
LLRPLASLVALLLGAEVQLGNVRVLHQGDDAEASRVARSLERAARALPAFTGAAALSPKARLCADTPEFVARTGLAPTAAAGVVEGEIVFPPTRVTQRFEDLDEVARHEVAHLAILEGLGRALPRWLVEGFAARLSGKAGPGPAPSWKSAPCARKLAELDASLVSRDASVRAAGYLQAQAIVGAFVAASGSAEALWKALAPGGGGKLPSRRLGERTLDEVLRAATGCAAQKQ